MFDYSKYENATEKQLIHALTLAGKRAEKLNSQLKENNELFKFLQKKLNNSFSTNKTKKADQRRPELDEAIEDYKNGNVEHYANVEEAFKALSAE
ncbi:LETM1 domain-containing protein [Campylobacter jejuni]|nr:LETM1 domain-containing protein [Campylobacter jejuni]MCW1685992.1 LETM1 domain-containing protein [Campylobacter jejuni]MCW1692067.1 LETM1 domain-containing protein [Campylobacter jejuni]